MKETNPRRRLTRNKLPFERFVRLFVVLELAVLFLYARRWAAFTVYGGRVWLLAALAAVCAGGSLVLSWRLERNWTSLVTGAALPVLAYEGLHLWRYSSAVRVILVAGGGAALAAGVVRGVKSARAVAWPRARRAVFLARAARVARTVCCLALLAACVYGRSLTASRRPVSGGQVAYQVSGDVGAVSDYANSLAANLEAVSKLDPDGGWAALSTREKTEVLETLVRIECRCLGMKDSAPRLELAYLAEGRLGEYDRGTDTVRLSYPYLVDAGADGYPVLRVLCHEMYHRYQHYQVDLLRELRDRQDMEKYTRLMLLDPADLYERELDHYVSPTKGSQESYRQYSAQRLERDAETYSAASEKEYRSRIRAYLAGE